LPTKGRNSRLHIQV